jgi:hypothetical protein
MQISNETALEVVISRKVTRTFSAYSCCNSYHKVYSFEEQVGYM